MNWKERGREWVQRNLRLADHTGFRHDTVGRDLNPERKQCPSNTNLRPLHHTLQTYCRRKMVSPRSVELNNAINP